MGIVGLLVRLCFLILVFPDGYIPISFLIFQTTKLFQSPDQEYQLGGNRRLAIGTRVISATVEGSMIEGLTEGQEVMSVFQELDVRALTQLDCNLTLASTLSE